MTLCLALGTNSALSDARIDTLIGYTGLMIRTLRIALAFTPNTASQRVASITRRTRAYWPFLVASIVSWRTDGIRSARVRTAKVLLRERPATDEGITSHVPWAAAHRRQSTQVAISINSTCTLTRVFTDTVNARRSSSWTIAITEALWSTLGEWAANVTLGTLANGSVVCHTSTGCTFTALIASVGALKLAAVLMGAALDVRFTLMPATR